MADLRFRHIEIKVGLLMMFVIAVIIVVIISSGISRNIFVKKIYIKVYTTKGDDISKGMPVKYSGFPISRVSEVSLQDDGRVAMDIGIPEQYIKWIRKDSIFKLGAQNIIGSNFIMIQTDIESKSPLVQKGDTFTLVIDQDIQSMIDKAMPVIEDLKEIVANINIILGRTADEEGDFNTFMKGLGALGNDIKNKEGSIGYLTRTDYIKKEIETFLDNLKKFSKTAVKTAQNIEKGSDTINNTLNKIDKQSEPILNQTEKTIAEAEEIIKTLKPSFERLDKITQNIERISENAADGTENLDKLRSEIQSMVETGNEILLKIEKIWPISSGKKTPEKVPLK